MIQTVHVEIPLTGDPDPIIATLNDKLRRIAELHPSLRGARLRASDGVLHMCLRCAGTDRWKVSFAARAVASAMLRRVKLDPKDAVIVKTETPPNARALTKAQGRNPNHTPRGHKKQQWEDA